MIGPDFLHPADPADVPLRAGLAAGDRLVAATSAALPHLIIARAAPDLASDAVLAQVAGLAEDLAERLARTLEDRPSTATVARLSDAVLANPALLSHCHAVAIEWALALRLQSELGLDPVAAPLLASWVSDVEAPRAELAMAALAAQSRFAQTQRRMELPLDELPAELLHESLSMASASLAPRDAETARGRQKQVRAAYDEAGTRLAILARLAAARGSDDLSGLRIEEAGAALWLSVLSARSGQDRATLSLATSTPRLERLLLSLRAAGLSPAEAQRQALQLQPAADIPAGLEETGTREAAQWLAGPDR